MKYILAIDQSTTSTKCIVFNSECKPVLRKDIAHKQIINSKGWVEHDGNEIYSNLIKCVKEITEDGRIAPEDIEASAFTNQRETSIIWDRKTGAPVYNAIVWQCGRAREICENLKDCAPIIKERTGMNLSPYFSAAKLAWIMKNIKPESSSLASGTMDSFILYKLSGGKVFFSEPSNASRTQLFDIKKVDWDEELLSLFSLKRSMMPEIKDSDSCFMLTDFEGTLPHPIPLHAVLGDSQAALYAHGCTCPGDIKVTHGTGSSVMMNTADSVISSPSLVSSIAWKLHGGLSYVLEGNINYCGALTQWAVDMGFLSSPKDAGRLASEANNEDRLFIVPAFTGLGAPYWNDNARTLISGIGRDTGKKEIVRACEEAIGFQISDIITLMEDESGYLIETLNADGGPTRDSFLMQFESDITRKRIKVSDVEELSAKGVALAAGRAIGLYDEEPYDAATQEYNPQMPLAIRERKTEGWKKALELAKQSAGE